MMVKVCKLSAMWTESPLQCAGFHKGAETHCCFHFSAWFKEAPLDIFSDLHLRPANAKRVLAEIWDALRAAANADNQTALVLLDTAGIIRTSDDLSVCYDERGGAPGFSHVLHLEGIAFSAIPIFALPKPPHGSVTECRIAGAWHMRLSHEIDFFFEYEQICVCLLP